MTDAPLEIVKKKFVSGLLKFFWPVGMLVFLSKKRVPKEKGKIAPLKNIRVLIETRGVEVSKEGADENSYEEAAQKYSTVLMALMLREALAANSLIADNLDSRQTIILGSICAVFSDVFHQFAHIDAARAQDMIEDALVMLYGMDQTSPPLDVKILGKAAIDQYQFISSPGNQDFAVAAQAMGDALYNYLAVFLQDAPSRIHAAAEFLLANAPLAPLFENMRR